jgi:Zn-dependent peptidase ImmA (M78 family)
MQRDISKACEILSKYGQHTPPFNPIAIAQGQDIKIMLCPRADWDGALDWTSTPTIYVNTSNTVTRQRFTVAHLLGHWFLHPQKQVFREKFDNHKGLDWEEFEANNFAGNLLMPWNHVMAYGQYEKGQDLANRFGVSLAALRTWMPDYGWK